MVEQKATKLISYCTGQQTGIDTPFVSYRKKYQPYRLRTGHTDKIRLFQPINAYRTETIKKKKKMFSLSHLSTHQRHSQFLKLIAHGLSSLKLQIFLTGVLLLSFKFTFSFLFPLSSFFFLGCVQCMPNSLNFNFFKHPIKLTACKCDV